jgi:hypothetical protein
LRLRIAYARPRDLVADHDEQFTRGGVLVRGEPPAGLALFQDVELEFAVPGAPIVVRAQVVQLVAGAGVAVAFTAASVAGLAEAVEKARALGEGAWPSAASAPVVGAAAKWASATNAERIQIALHGNRDERAMVLRDTNRTLHPYVLRNPNLQLDEILAIAKMTTVSADLLRQIAERREWCSRPEIAIALVRNPTVPVPIAVKLVDHVSPAELRQLAKDTRTRTPVQQAARKKINQP